MKFQRLACNCCKTSADALQCQSPTYVLSEVVDNSNVIFLLISKAGRTSCGGPLAIDRDTAGEDAEGFRPEHGLGERGGFFPDGRAQAIIDSCSHPAFRPAFRDDFERRWRGSPGQPGLRLVREAPGLRRDRRARRKVEKAATADA